MKYIDYITDQIIFDIAQIVIFFEDYQYLTWIFVIAFYIFWLSIKYFIITLPFRMLFQNVLPKIIVQVKDKLFKKN
jgi:hypothetical protein